MTRIRKFVPENKLAKVLQDPNGLLFGHALQRAGANIELVRDTHLAALEKKLDALALQASVAENGGDADQARFYALAREIFADAGTFRLREISRAAHSLCELMASGRSRKQLWAGVAVHVHAISALRRGKNEPGRMEAILAGLETISRAPSA